jgi:Tfp pilus assembly PilM family ATPase
MKIVTGDADARSFKIRGYAEMALPVGGMINGIITDADIMADFFSRVATDYGLTGEPSTLVLNNNNIQAKSMEIPPVSEDMALDFIRREYSQYDEGDAHHSDDVYDYTVLSPNGPNGGVRILAVGVARELLETYRDVITGAGIDLKRIDIGVNCQIKLAMALPQLQQGSVILVLLDDRSLSLTLFENGEYVLTNRYRLTHGNGDPGLIEEIGGNISSMIQFNKTQKESAAITAAYIAGAGDAGAEALRASLTYLGIEIRKLDMSEQIMLQGSAQESGATFDEGRYILNLGGLLRR